MKTLLILTLSVMLAACGGGGGGGGGKGGGGGDEAATVDGTLVDGEIAGVTYESPSFSGVTDSDGKYQCKEGETVEFSLTGSFGETVELGSILCRKLISPIEMVTQGLKTVESDLTDLEPADQQKVVNLLRFFQTMDSDGDPSNGITIISDDVSDLATFLADSEVDFESDGLDSMLNVDDLGMDAILNTMLAYLQNPRVGVSRENALAHFENTKKRCATTGCVPRTSNPDPAPEDNGGGSNEEQASVVKCLSGKTYADWNIGLGQDFSGGAQFPVDPVSGTLIIPETILLETLVVMKSDGSASVYRSRLPGEPYYYEFATSGWTEASPNEGETAGELTVSQVAFANGNFNLKFESQMSWQTNRMAIPSFLGTDEPNDLIWTESESCSVPSDTVVLPN